MKTALKPLIHSNSTILILGTMPGEKSLQLQQYYGNKGNQFWKLMYTIFEETFSFDYSDRKALLQKHQIALWDVLSHCERMGSLDSNIKNEVANDFQTLYNAYPKIKTVFFSSIAASKYYDKYALRAANISYYILPSPSGANATMKFEKKLEFWQKIKDFATL